VLAGLRVLRWTLLTRDERRVRFKMNKRLIITVILTVAAAITGIWLAFADQYTGGSGDGWYAAESSDFEIGGTEVTISSAQNQIFKVRDYKTTAADITITDSDGGAITAANDIRVTVPSSFYMKWKSYFSGTTDASNDNFTILNPINITPANIVVKTGGSVSAGPFKITDTVTVTWNNGAETGPDNDDVTGATCNFSSLGGSTAVTMYDDGATGGDATADDDIWTASYVIASGDIDSTTAVVAVTATDGTSTKTTSDTTALTIDNIVPVLTDANISITSTGSGTGGVYLAGDTLTVQWDDTSSGENNTDTISTVTCDFSALGGGAAVNLANGDGLWIASYDITTASISGVHTVSLLATDNAGNTTATDDTTDIQVAPGAGLSASTVVPASLVAGETGNVTVSFTTVNTLPSDGKIEVTFPTGFVLSSGTATTASSSTMDGDFAVGVSSPVVTVTRSGGSAQTAAAETLILTYIKNSTVSGLTGVYAVETQDSYGNTIDKDTAVTASTIVSAATTSITLNAPDDIIAGGTRAGYTVTRYDEFSNLSDQGAETFYLYTTSTGVNAGFYDVVSEGSAVTSIEVADGSSESDFWYYDELMGAFTNTVSEIDSNAVYSLTDTNDTDFGDGTASGIEVSGSGSSAELILDNYLGYADWQALAPLPADIGERSGLAATDSDTIYALRGDDSPDFYKYTVSANTWEQKADFPVGTGGNSLIAVEGKVYALVSGTLYVYNPATDTWSSLATASQALYRMAASDSDTIYAMWYQYLQEYTISTNTWVQKTSSPEPYPYNFIAVNGKLYHGKGGSTNFYEYDISSDTWGTLAPMLYSPGAGCVMIGIGDDTIYAINRAGYNDTPPITKYTISTNTWVEDSVIGAAPQDGTAITAIGDVIYAFPGAYDYYFPLNRCFYKYDTAKDVVPSDWSSLAAIPDVSEANNLGYASITAVGTDTIYFGSYWADAVGDAFYKYTISTNEWLKMDAPPERVGTTHVFVAMGTDTMYGFLNGSNLYKYTIATDEWLLQSTAPYSIGRYAALLVAGDDTIYVMPGQYKTGFWRYTISTDNWEDLTPISSDQYGACALTMSGDDTIYALNGVSSRYLYKYTISTDAWEAMETTPLIVNGYSLVTVNDNAIYLLGGVNVLKYIPADNAWEHLIPSLPDALSGMKTAVCVGGNTFYGIRAISGGPFEFYKLSTGYESPGTFTSRIMDTTSNETFGTATWNAATPADTTLTIKARTSDDEAMSGATDWTSCSVLTSGEDISGVTGITDTDRYIQYYAEFATTDVTVTPALSDITFGCNKSATGGFYDTDSINVKHAAPNRIAFSGDISGPQKAGAVFTLPSIKALDLYGNLLNSDYSAAPYAETVTVSYALSGASDAPDANATDSFTTNVAFAGGTSTTALNTILYRGQDTTITPSTEASGLTGDTTESNSITVDPETQNKVVFTQEPSATGIINSALAIQPIVVIQDFYGNQTADTDNITLYDSTSNEVYMDADGILSATANPLATTDGQSEFGGVKYSLPGEIYLYAETSGIAADFSQAITLSRSATSTVAAADTPAPNFSLVPTNDNIDNSFEAIKFKLTDAGEDVTPTLIDRMQIAISGTGGAASTDIAWAGLYIGETQVTTVTGDAITDDYITFGSTPDAASTAGLYSLADSSSTEFTVYIYMKDGKLSAVENNTYIFDINEALIGVDNGLSSQMASDSESITPVTGTVSVTVSHIEVVTEAGNDSLEAVAGSGDNIRLHAVDANKNIDTDYIGNQTFKFSGLSQIGVYKPKTDSTVFGNNKTIAFTAGVSLATSLTAYTKESGDVSVEDQNHLSYSSFDLSVDASAASGASIALTSGDSQSGAINATLTQPFVATILDAYGNPATGEVVEYAISVSPNGSSGQSLSLTQDDSDDDGLVSTVLTLGNIAGNYQVTATSSGLTGSPLTYTAAALEPTGLSIVSGNNQIDKTVTQDTNPLVIKYSAAGDIAVPNVDIGFEIISFPDTATGQELSETTVATNDNGEAQVVLTLGNKIGSYVVRASVGIFNIDFTVTALPDIPYKVVLTGPSSVAAGAASGAFTVSIKDTYDNLSGVTTDTIISVESTSASTASFYSDVGGLNLLTNSSITLSTESSEANFYYKDTLVGTPTITASVTSGQTGLNTDSDDSNVSVIPSAIHHFKVTGLVSAMIAGESREITITAYDIHDNVKTNYNGDINIIFSGVTAAPSEQSPTCSDKDSTDINVGSSTTLTFGSGVTASTLKIYKAESAAIGATAGAVVTSEDNDLEFVVRHAAVDHLKFGDDLSSPQAAGAEFALGTTIDVVDIYDNICDGANGATAYAQTDKTVTWTLSGESNGPQSGTDVFTNPVSFSAGRSTNTLQASLYRAQSTTITPSVVGVSGTNEASNEIVVLGGEVDSIRFTQQPSASCITTQALAQQPQISVSDEYGNSVAQAEANISLAASTTTGVFTAVANGALSADFLTVEVSDGLAEFSGVTYSYPENIYLRASIAGYDLASIYSSLITFSTASEATVLPGNLSEPSTISSLSDTVLEKVNILDFKITDPGADGYGTKIKQMVIAQSGDDTAETWTDYIEGAYITDGITQVLAIVEDSRLVFGSGSSVIYTVADDSNKTFVLSVFLKSSLPAGADNKVIGFSMNADTNITLDTLSSTFASTSALTTSPNITVIATNFIITGDATMLAGLENIISLKATDANSNKDEDYTGDKALEFSGASDSANGNHPTCTNFSGTDVVFGSSTIVSFADGVNTSTVTMKLYKSESAIIKAGDGTLITSDDGGLRVTVSGGIASDLLWGIEPATIAVANSPWKEFVVNITDSYGNITSSNVDVSINISGGTLGIAGVGTQTASSGLVTFRKFAVVCSSYPGVVTITASADGVTSTPASDQVTISGKYNVTVNVNDYTTGTTLTELTFDLLDDGVTMSSEGFPMTGNSPFEFELPHGTYTLTFEKEQYLSESSEKVAGVAADGLDGTYDNNITWTVVVSSLAEATSDYSVMSGITYDETSDKLSLRLWLERRGKLVLNDDVNKLGIGSIEIYDDASSAWLDSITLAAPPTNDITSGLYFREITSVTAPGGAIDLVAGKTYFAKCKISYGGLDGTARLYEGGTTFSITISQSLKVVTAAIEDMSTDIKSEVTGVTTAVAAQAAVTQAVVASQAAATQAVIASGTATTQAAVAAGTAATQTNITTIGSTITSNVAAAKEVLASNLQLESASRLLNQQSTVRNNDTLVVRYKTNSGLEPVISVYDPRHNLRIENEVMTETIPGESGIYESNVRFVWGIGEHTIVCQEVSTGTLDGMNIEVIQTDLDDISSALTTATATLTGIDTDELGGLSAKMSDVNAFVSRMVSSVDELTALKSKTEDLAAGASDAIYKQLEIATQKLKEINDGQGIKIEKMYDLSEEQATDTDYIKNKTLEIKALVELSKDILSKTDDKPIVKSWLETSTDEE